MISVKICGITSPADADLSVRAGARALGFVFYGLSPRAVSPAQARECIASVPAGIKKVGVFVNMKKEHVLDLAQKLGLDMVQLSGDETPDDCRWLTAQGARVVKALRPRGPRDLQKLETYREHVFAFNIDSLKEGEYGGTGQTSDWILAKKARDFGRPVILAGGLTGGNVIAAIKMVEPSALDVCSGVEREPGKKDPRKLKGLFEALWRYDEELRKSGGAAASATSGRLRPVAQVGPPSASGPLSQSGKVAAGPAPEAAPPAPGETPLVDRVATREPDRARVEPPLADRAEPEADEPPLVDRANASGWVTGPARSSAEGPEPPPGPPGRKP